jgi:hypothetical protein
MLCVTGDLDTQEFSKLIVCTVNKQRILVMIITTCICVLHEPGDQNNFAYFYISFKYSDHRYSD